MYAAATRKKYRGKGFMGKLICEAKEYVVRNNISFISLVPANEGLYGYYARFGFSPIMKNFVSVKDDIGLDSDGCPLDAKAFINLRNHLPEPYFSFHEKEWIYALSCLEYADYSIIRNTEDSCYILNDVDNEILEYVSSEKNFTKNTEIFLNRIKDGAVIVSPYDLSSFCPCTERKFGMLYIADGKMKECINDAVYMNIALD